MPDSIHSRTNQETSRRALPRNRKSCRRFVPEMPCAFYWMSMATSDPVRHNGVCWCTRGVYSVELDALSSLVSSRSVLHILSGFLPDSARKIVCVNVKYFPACGWSRERGRAHRIKPHRHLVMSQLRARLSPNQWQ